MEEEQKETSSLGLNRMCLDLIPLSFLFGGFPGGTEGKNQPANAGDLEDMDWIPGLARSPGAEMATHSSVLAWKIPWAEEPGGLQSTGSKKR